MSVDASLVMARATRLERARNNGHPDPLAYAITGGRLPTKPLHNLAPFTPPAKPAKVRSSMFAGLCPLCGTRTAGPLHCYAHRWAD